MSSSSRSAAWGILDQLAGMMPGNLGKQLQGASIDEKALAHTEAIILSMTPQERENPRSWLTTAASGASPRAADWKSWM